MQNWEDCRQAAIEAGKPQFALEYKQGATASCMIGHDFSINGPSQQSGGCTAKDSSGHAYGGGWEAAVYMTELRPWRYVGCYASANVHKREVSLPLV